MKKKLPQHIPPILLVYGSIGSGKTRLTQRISKTPYAFGFYTRPVIWNADSFVHSLHTFVKIQKSLQEEIPYPLNIALFTTPPKQKKRYWNILESLLHPYIITEIKRLYNTLNVRSRGLVIDMALKHLLPPPLSSYQKLLIPSPKVYPLYFSLYKYRNTEFYKIRYFLQRYAFHSNSSDNFDF